MNKTYIRVAGAVLVASLLSAQSAVGFEPELGEAIPGTQVSLIQTNFQTLPVPSVMPSDQGTMLVTWYGHESSTCTDGGEVSCVTLGRVLDSDGAPLTEIFRLGDEGAPNYYGNSNAAWNPEDREWVVFWNSLDDSMKGESGLYMRRVSEDGEVLGDVYAQSNQFYDPRLPGLATGSNEGSNSSLLWLEEQSAWLLLSFNYAGNFPNKFAHVTYTLLDAELNHLSGETAIWLTEAGRPYGAYAEVDPTDGSVLLAYSASDPFNQFEVRDLTISGSTVITSDPLVIADVDTNPAVSSKASPAIGFNGALGEFVVSYSTRESGRSKTYLVRVSNDGQPTILGEELAITYPSLVTEVNKPTLAFDAADGLIRIAQQVKTPESAAAYFTLDAITYQQVGNLMQFAETEVDNTSQRPILGSFGDFIAYTYMSFLDYGWGNEPMVRAGWLSFGEAESVEPEPIDYRGPNIENAPKSSAAGAVVTFNGSNLAVIEGISIDGKPVSNLTATNSAVSFTVPQLPKGNYDLKIKFTGGQVDVQRALDITGEPAIWTKRISSNEAKFYAKNVDGAGKVQFILNGKEIAWLNALDASDPKLVSASGFSYLVRTATLKAGKNVLEIRLDGDRLKRVVYTR